MRPRHVALACTEADRLVLHEVTSVDDALLDVGARPVAAIFGQPRRAVNRRCDVAALRAELAFTASPQVPHDLLGPLPLLGLLLRLARLLLVDHGQRPLRRLAGGLEVAAAEPEDRDPVRELLLEDEAAAVEVGPVRRAVRV